MLAQRGAGILLIVGTVAFFFGVSIPPLSGLGVRVWAAPLEEYLQLIAANTLAWRWTNLGIIVGTLLTALGLTGLTVMIWERGDRLYSIAGLILFLLAAVFWILCLSFRLSVTTWASREAALSGSLPSLYEALKDWVGLLFSLYMLLAYIGTASYGVGLLTTGTLPPWLGWGTVGAGFLGVISYAGNLPTIFTIPAGVHLVPLVVGISLLR